MSDTNRVDPFRGKHVVVSTVSNTSGSASSANSTAMKSTALENNSNGTKEMSAALNSLAVMAEPTGPLSNQKTSPVATFPQRTTGGSPASNTASPFGGSFTQQSSGDGPIPFSFSGLSITTTSTGPADQNASRQFSFSPSINFGNQGPMPSFAAPANGMGSMVFNNSASTAPPSKAPTASTPANAETKLPSRWADLPTPTSDEVTKNPLKNEEADEPESLANQSLMSKKIHTKLRNPQDLVVDQDDPTSPLFSLKSFEELNLRPELLKGIYQMGFRKPSRIQEITLPRLLANPPKNIIAQSQSGTGKTGAFTLTILSRIDPSVQSPQALILAPTFELALQIGSVIEQMAQFMPYITVAYAIRENQDRKTNIVKGQLLQEPIVVGTPGTVEDWCSRRRVLDLSRLRMFCIDEADVMIDTQGFQQACVALVKRLNPQCQMMLFSATYSDEVMTFAKQVIPNPDVLRLRREKQTLKNICQYYIICNNQEEKYAAIQQIYVHLVVGQTMIFCRTKATARELAVRMSNEKHSVRELTGALDIEQRANVIRFFREGGFRVLISTNVTARGIDIDDVSLVINYDMPVTVKGEPDYENYLHRIGRCGRFGKTGSTFNLIGSERDFTVMKEIENYYQHSMIELTIDQIASLGIDDEQ